MKNMKQVESKASNQVRLQIYSQTNYQAWRQIVQMQVDQLDLQVWGWLKVSVLTEMKKFVR